MPFRWQHNTALVGSANRKYLWLLARRPDIDEATKQDFLEHARREGFELDGLIHTPQTGRSTA